MDRIIAQRRSIRRFKENIPPKEYIEQVIQAGIRAPYAGMTGRQLSEVRRFAVFTKNTEMMARVQQVMMSEMKRNARKLGERKGFPPVEKQSLAYVMENMWLKATALGLGFQLVSATQTMAKNKAFMQLANIPFGEFDVGGCFIGYPDETPAAKKEIPVNELTHWS